MNRVVKLGAVSCLAVLVGGVGIASAEAPAKKRKPTLFEQIFGSPSKSRAERSRKNRSRIFVNRDQHNANAANGIQVINGQDRDARRKTPNVVVADSDPEGDPGLGRGNLRYAAPKLVGLSGLKLADPRPAEASAQAIHDQLSGEGPSLRVLPEAREALLDQYRSQNFRPIWLENGKLSVRGAAVLKQLSSAAEDGLEPEAYLPTGLSAFDAPLPENDPAAMARLDIDLAAAALRYARDASGGLFDPRKLSLYHDVTPQWVPASRAIKVLAWSPYAAEYLKELHPAHPAYSAMKTELTALRAKVAQGVADPIPEGDLVKKGMSDPRIPAVRRKLAELGYAEALVPSGEEDVLDAELSVVLRRLQKASGIKVTGVLGPQTVGALNTDVSTRRLATILDNMERLRWLPKSLGARHVFVNQAAFEARVMENGKELWKTRVIVGKPNTQTSVFHDEMELVVFNPSWGVPPSIIANEYLPKLRRDPGYLDRIGFKVVNQNGKVVPSRSIDWGSYGSKVPYGIHQPPGEDNALGEIKFLFPNSHNIYMHDTPSRELFEKDERAFSHGCVRVQNPRDFASVLLGWDAKEVAAHIETPKSETVRLKQKVPVHLTYFTAWPDETGRIVYFDDIYGRDKAMEEARSTVVLAQR